MKRKDIIMLILIILLITIFIALFLVVINKFQKVDYPNAEDNFVDIDLANLEETGSNTLYAKIEKINNTSLTVEELQGNEWNQKDEFSFGIEENTELKRKNKKINLSDLSVGQTILITYIGGIKESYPGQIDNVTTIEVLD